MKDYLTFAILGIGAGAVIGALGLGIVLGHRGSGVVNFALGAVATYVAYIFNALRVDGDLVPPIGKLDLGGPMAMAPAILISLVAAAILGVLMHLLIFRPLRYAPPLAKVVASIGLTLVLQAIVVLRFGPDSRFVPAVLPDDSHTVEIFGFFVPHNRFYLAGIVILTGIVLAAVFRFTKLGLSMRGAAESEKGATLLGYSPDFQAGTTWVFASMLAGLGGILLAPIVSLDPQTFTLLIVPALAAALVGSFASFGWTVGAGLLIGAGQSVLLKAEDDVSWLPAGSPVVLPMIVLVVVLFVRGRALPERGTLVRANLPAAPLPRHVLLSALVSLVVGVVLLYTFSGGYRLGLMNSLIAAIICLSFVVIIGYVGQISLVQMALAGTSAFMLSRMADHWGIPFPWAPILAALCATVVGLVIALPALRIRGTQLAVVTLAAALTIDQLYFQNADLTGAGVTSGAIVPDPGLLGLDLSISGNDYPRPAFGILALVVLVGLGIVVANLRRSALGRQMLAVRADETAAAVAGVNVTLVKIIAFGLSAFIAGIGGTLLAYSRGELSPASFAPTLGLLFLAFAYLGGISSVSGAVFAGLFATGGLLFVGLDDAFALGKYQTLIGGVGLILTAILNPEGVSGAVRDIVSRVRERASRAGPDPQPTVQEMGA